MNRDLILRSSAVLALCFTGFVACSDDDDNNDAEMGVGSNMAAAGSDMDASGGTGMGGSEMTPANDDSAGGSDMGTQESGAMANGGIAGGAMGGADMGDNAAATGEASADMSFFVTSEGSTTGGDIGGLAGADERCQTLAAAAGAGDKTWQAYLSTDGADGENARDRIGSGPWMNFDGVEIASDIDDLLDVANVFNGVPNLILTELGENAPGPEHDILTGSDELGMAEEGLNCENWTSGSAELTDNPRVGHSDIPDPMFSPSWNNAHESQNCSQAGLVAFGGAGRLYCFAL